MPERKIYTVGEINRRARSLLEDALGGIWLEGEVSRLNRHASGHWYFTLKDQQARIDAVMFRGDRHSVPFEVKDGLKINAYGIITVYEPSGKYQIRVTKMEEAGKGSLQEAFEKLKKKLAEEGLFDEARKQPIPILPRIIGVVTSPTGAALQDILNVLNRRFPNYHLILAPVRVQGDRAASQIVRGIEAFNELGTPDVLMVGRGGGSLEDLWCFNEEIVARAIAASNIPVISAVGHEIDFTISDFVADLRAPTPSAAAELVVGRKDAFAETLSQMHRRLLQALRSEALTLRNRYTAAAGSYAFREPSHLVRHQRQRMEQFQQALQRTLMDAFRERQQKLDDLHSRSERTVGERSIRVREKLVRLESQLRALSPLAVLDRGFSITMDGKGRAIKSVQDAPKDGKLTTRLKDGRISSTVDCINS